MFADVNTNLRKTILYIGGFELPDKNAAAHRVVANGKALRELGYSVVFFDSNRECNKFKNRLSPIQEFGGSYYSTAIQERSKNGLIIHQTLQYIKNTWIDTRMKLQG